MHQRNTSGVNERFSEVKQIILLIFVVFANGRLQNYLQILVNEAILLATVPF